MRERGVLPCLTARLLASPGAAPRRGFASGTASLTERSGIVDPRVLHHSPLNFPALFAVPELFDVATMPHRTLTELHVELFNRLRSTSLYSRLKNVEMERSKALPCGWRAEILGDFTVAEHNEVNEIVSDLQRRFSIRSDPLDSAERNFENP